MEVGLGCGFRSVATANAPEALQPLRRLRFVRWAKASKVVLLGALLVFGQQLGRTY